jgi:hypothetical protein
MSSPTPNAMPGARPAPDEEPASEPAAETKTPPWGSDEEFQPDRAWELITKLRQETAEYKNLVNSDEAAKKALESTRQLKKLQTQLDQLTEYKSKADPVLEEHERLRRASQTELDRAREDLEALSAREAAWRNKAVAAEAHSAAARFIDADAAMALVGDLSSFAGPDGVDSEALHARFDQLAADKPHLLKAPPGFTPNRAQGQSGTGQIPIDAQISAAQDRGDLITAIALKQAKRYAQ